MKIYRSNTISMLAILLTSLFASCSRVSSLPEQAKSIFGDIFSNRPQSKEQLIAIVRLPGKSLLETATRDGRKTEIDPDAKLALEAEQKELETRLAALSPDIKILYRYKLALNALAVLAPAALEKDLRGISGVSYVEGSHQFSRPDAFITSGDVAQESAVNIEDLNSTTHIKAKQAREQYAITGHGMRVGILDTGIDYTHAMMGGAGTEEAYKAIDPSKVTDSFPNQKVVGGIDLVGSDFDSGSPVFARHIPVPDGNPLDESGLGSHVAGTIGGIGDGVNTYTGIAPGADLYAVKVFGKDGSTSDIVVIAALEWAMDPNADGDLSDRLDVVNLSLGSDYGNPQIPYSEAVKNVSKGGLMVVASAGNSGPNTFVTGAPASSLEAISVAASVDGMDHNWKFNAVEFLGDSSAQQFFAEAIEASFTKPIQEVGALQGQLVYVGDASADFSDEVKAQIVGKVALIDRGKVAFVEKVKRAREAGAIGVVVANNVAGDAFGMGGTGEEKTLPAIMITLENGAKLKEWMKTSTAQIKFQTETKIEKPELIDSITSFSSQGPRVEDAIFKPEISAPGSNIISAEMGKGNKGVQFSGTSMAAPHMSGVMALLLEKFPGATPEELKSLVMGTAVDMFEGKEKVQYPLSLQGSGRVDVLRAIQAKVFAFPQAISLGQVGVDKSKTIRKTVALKNITDHEIQFNLKASATHKSLAITLPETITLKAGEQKTIAINFAVKTLTAEDLPAEDDGFVTVSEQGVDTAHIPFLVRFARQSNISAGDLKIAAASPTDDLGALVQLPLKNQSLLANGDVLAFNLLGLDPVKVKTGKENSTRNLDCDLVGAGYRVISREGELILQLGVKLARPLNFWVGCEVSVLLDSDNDGVAEQEIAGILEENLPGQTKKQFSTLLLDAAKVREQRKTFEQTRQQDPKSEVKEDYQDSIISMHPFTVFPYSSVAVLEVPLENLATNPNGDIQLRLGVLDIDQGAIEPDDFLGTEGQWFKVSLDPKRAPFIVSDESVGLNAGQETVLSFEKGEGQGDLLVFLPQNTWWGTDAQMILPKVKYE